MHILVKVEADKSVYEKKERIFDGDQWSENQKVVKHNKARFQIESSLSHWPVRAPL